MISVIIPLYNKAKTIKRTLESIHNQSYQDFEVIVVDDGSTDDSFRVVSEFNDPRIKIYRQSNQGVSAARNHAVELSSGDYVAFLDADDEWDPDYLETQVSLIRSYPEASIFGTNYRFKDSSGNYSNTILNRIKLGGYSGVVDNYFEIASHSHVPIWSSAVAIKKSAFNSVGGFPLGIKSGEDLLTWARLAVRYKIAYNRSPKVTYNLDEAYKMTSKPVRRQDKGDPVGCALLELYKQNKTIPFFRQYISHWHKMRASVAIRFGDRWETLMESFKALYYNPRNYKVFPFIVLSLFPSGIRKRLIGLKKTV